jgi:hypothetical protein
MRIRTSRPPWRKRQEPKTLPPAGDGRLPRWVRIADVVALVLLGLAVGIALSGGSRFNVGGLVVSITSWQRLVYQSLALLAIRHAFVPRPAIHQQLRVSAARSRPALAAVTIPLAVYLVIAGYGYDGGPYLRGDCIYYYQTAISIIRDGDLDLSNQFPELEARQFSDQFAFTADGRPVPKHPIVMPIASVPFVGLFGESGALTFNLFQLAALLAVLYRLAARVASRGAAAAAVVLTGIFSVLPHYVYNYSPDVFSAFLLAAGLLALPTPGDRHPLARTLLAGLLTGAGIVSKYALILFAPAMLALLQKPRVQQMCALAIGVDIPLAAFLALNAQLFGSPLTTPYDRLATIGPDGHIQIYSQRASFVLNPVLGAYGQLFDPVHGLLFSSPITLPSLAGLFLLARRHRALAWYLGGSSLALFLFFTTYDQWDASHYGNRFLMAVIALAAMPLAVLLERASLAFVTWRIAGTRPVRARKRSAPTGKTGRAECGRDTRAGAG